jgi:hypothetical protein
VLVWREQAREGIPALDDLEHRLLLTEEILLRPPHDRDLAVPADAGRLHFLDGAGDGLEFRLKTGLEADKDAVGAHGVGGDEYALHKLIRVDPDQGPVLEGSWFAFGAVADDVPLAAGLCDDARPLAPRRKPSASPTPQPGRSTSAIVSEGPSSWARCRPRPPVSPARYSSREAMGDGGSRNVGMALLLRIALARMIL